MGTLRRRSTPIAVFRALLAWPWMIAWTAPLAVVDDDRPTLALGVLLLTLAAIGWLYVVRPRTHNRRLVAWLRLRPTKLYFRELLIVTLSLLALAFCTIILHALLTSLGVVPGLRSDESLFTPVFLQEPSGMATYFLALVALAPLAEELAFRGWMQHGLEHSVGLTTAIVVPAILFSISHGLIGAVHHLPFALFVGWLVWKTGSVWPGIVVHVMNNALVAPLVLLDSSTAPFDSYGRLWPYALGGAAIALAIFFIAARQIDRKASLDRPLRHHPHSWWARLGRPAPPASNA